MSLKEQKVTPAVIDACRRGDREAFRVLYEAHKDKVYSMAVYFFRGDSAAAADVTQDVFLKLMDSVGQFRGQSDFSTWLHRFVANACIDRTRRRWWRMTTVDPVGLDQRPSASSHEEDYLKDEMARAVQEAVAELTPKIRMAIVLRYFSDLTYEEMAVALNCSAGTVASRLSRGHQMLARRLRHASSPALGEKP